MAEMLLINPRRRRKAAPKRRTAAKRRRNPIAAVSRAPVRRRRRNPIALRKVTRTARRRRRNPIGLGMGARGIMARLTDALLGGAGAVGMDVIMGQIAPYLPVMLKRVPGKVGLGDAVKAVATVALGEVLNKPTRGASRKMASGALSVQAAEIIKTFLPTGLTLGEMGYASPAYVVPGYPTIGPNNADGFSAYVAPGVRNTPLLSGDEMDGLSAYVGAGRSPLLSDADDSEYSEAGVFRG